MATAAAPAAQELEYLGRDTLRPSPSNPRRKFLGIEELAGSIKLHGIIKPLLARPVPEGSKGKETHEVVDGERRWRAAGKAKLELVPVIVRDYTDAEVLEMQLLSSVHDEPLNALEEADGYQRLASDFGYSPEQIASKVNQTTAYVSRRLKLCNLVEKGRELFLADRMTLDAAFVIARIPDAKGQAEALKNLTTGYEFREGATITAQDARAFVRRYLMLELAKAPFSTADATLVPIAGACGPCPHRSGNQGVLFDDVKGKDICTNPPCFEKKKDADFKRKADAAKEQGKKVLSEAEAKKVFPHEHTDRPAHGSGMVRLDGEIGYEHQGKIKGNPKTWKQALGKNAPEPVLAQHPAGGAVELVPLKDALKVLKDAGKIEKPKKSTESPKEKERRAKEKQDNAIREVALLSAIGKIADKAATANLDMGTPKASPFWRWIAKFLVESDPYTAAALMEKRRPKPAPDDEEQDFSLDVLFNRAKTAGDVRALAVEIVVAESAEYYTYAEGDADDPFQTACRLFGVDWKAELAAAKKAAKDEGEEPEKSAKPKRGGK